MCVHVCVTYVYLTYTYHFPLSPIVFFSFLLLHQFYRKYQTKKTQDMWRLEERKNLLLDESASTSQKEVKWSSERSSVAFQCSWKDSLGPLAAGEVVIMNLPQPLCSLHAAAPLQGCASVGLFCSRTFSLSQEPKQLERKLPLPLIPGEAMGWLFTNDELV